MKRQLRDEDYEQLLKLRTSLRRFLLWSKEQAAEAGLAPAQHQLLLAIRGHRDERGPTVGEVAWYLLLQHHSAVELIDRAERAGLVRRARDAESHRHVRVRLTKTGEHKLEKLTELHLEELSRLGPILRGLVKGLGDGVQRTGTPSGAVR